MAEALAHGADVNSVNEENEGKSPLIQAVIGVSHYKYIHAHAHINSNLDKK